MYWHVTINNGQKAYVVNADNAGEAAMLAGDLWRADATVKLRQLAKGVYDIRVRKAKFGEVRQQAVIPVQLREDT